jgi:hypothetical protein
MNTIETQTPVATKLTPYQNKLRLNRKYYHQKYESNKDGFRDREIQRNGERVKAKYANDPDYKARVIQQAKDRYWRLKAEKEQQEIEERLAYLRLART